MNRKLHFVAAACVATLFVALLGVVVLESSIESRRIADARPAFEPLVPLRPELFSQPVAFNRYCRYVLMFQPESQISDENASSLLSLNLLPNENDLDVSIHTPTISDASLDVLKRITTLDLLDVTDTSISDGGIATLTAAMPNVAVVSRAPDAAEPSHTTEPAAEPISNEDASPPAR